MEIKERRDRLERARSLLKKEFVGINGQIDDIIDTAYSWYCFPEGQIRPVVLNLVGVTGVGKTSLIERLFALLDMENVLYKFDMGYYANDSENLKHELSKKVRTHHNDPVCFVFDEFQLSRSINEDGEEVDRSNFRPVWDLLDSGKINLIEPSYGVESLNVLRMKLERCVENGLRSRGLNILKGDKYFLELFGKDGFDDVDIESNPDKELDRKPTMVPNSYFYHIQQCVPNRFVGDGELRQYLSLLKDEHSIIDFLRETVEMGTKPKVYDFSNSIIFVIANIDEAFVDVDDMDPDMDADDMHDISSEVTIFDIKNSLRKRFRAEQIARLGNNYVIYPTFNSNVYRQLIDMELEKKSNVMKEKFGMRISFEDSIKKLLYDEGVFPMQGTRPVFTTINYVIGSFIGRAISDIAIHDMMDNVKTWTWKFENDKNIISLLDESGRILKELEYKPKIKVDSLRKAKMNDEHAIVSVHEAGHAIVCASLLGHVPSKVISSSAGGSDGLNWINWKKFKGVEYAKKMASIYLSGIEAEKLVFGAERCTVEGAESDIERATSIITKMVQESGTLHPVVKRGNPHNERTDSIKDVGDQTAMQVENILKLQKDVSKAVLTKYKKALIALSLELFNDPVLYKDKIEEILTKNGMALEPEKEYYKMTLLQYAK